LLAAEKVLPTLEEAVEVGVQAAWVLASDPHTQVIIAFIEGIRSPQQFVAAAQAAAEAGKPILLVKVGRSEAARRAVQAHTGSLAGSDAVCDAVFRRLGVMRLDTLDELMEAAELFRTCPLPAGEGVGLLSLSGGWCYQKGREYERWMLWWNLHLEQLTLIITGSFALNI